MIRCKIPVFLLAFAFLLLFLGACQTPQEKAGYSKIPQNHPAKWEDKHAPGVNF